MSKKCCIRSLHICQNSKHNKEKKGNRLSDFTYDEKDDIFHQFQQFFLDLQAWTSIDQGTARS